MEPIKSQLIDQGLETRIQQAQFIALAQHPRDIPGLDAGRNQQNLATHQHRCRHRGDVIDNRGDRRLSMEIVMEAAIDAAGIKTEQHVDAWGLTIRIHHPNPFALLGQHGIQAPLLQPHCRSPERRNAAGDRLTPSRHPLHHGDQSALERGRAGHHSPLA